MMNRKKWLTITALVGVYAMTTGASYAAFRFLGTTPKAEFTSPVPTTSNGGLAIDPDEPKNQACPVNGKMFTKTEQQVWEKLRPLAVMIENHLEARPQSGLAKADVVYEAIAEGGITRFLAVFYCEAVAKETLLGPVRSARTYFLDWTSEYGEKPLYVHVGGANLPGPADALGQIQKYNWGGRSGNDLNQFAIGYPTFWRDYERLGRTVATEHTMYTTTAKLWAEAKKRGWTNLDPQGKDWQEKFTEWKWEDEVKPDKRGDVNSVSFEFWDDFKEYQVKWEYDRESNSYRRINGEQPQVDLNDNQQITAKVMIVQFAKEKGPIDELKHLLYQTTGKGEALVFQNGQAIKATWEKPDRLARTLFKDDKGKEMKFVRGQMWIEVLPAGQEVTY